MKKHYCLGFVFSQDDQVLLIRKARPAHLAGYLNGIGGQVETGEASFNAMQRECREETCLRVVTWNHFLTMIFPDCAIDCFLATVPCRADDALPGYKPDEPVHWVPISLVHQYRPYHNVESLIRLALDCRERKL